MNAGLRRAALPLLVLAGAIGCGDATTTPNPSDGGVDTTVKHHPPHVDPDTGAVSPLETGLWMASATPSAVLRLAADQLDATGARAPATAITTPSGALLTLVSVAFDTDGSLWVAGRDDSRLLRFAPSALAGGGERLAATVILPNAGSVDQPTGLAFDRQHRLWVANNHNGTLARFDREQLAAGGAVAPAVVLTIGGRPTGLAFDASGALWVSDHAAVTIAKFSAAQLEASGVGDTGGRTAGDRSLVREPVRTRVRRGGKPVDRQRGQCQHLGIFPRTARGVRGGGAGPLDHGGRHHARRAGGPRLRRRGQPLGARRRIGADAIRTREPRRRRRAAAERTAHHRGLHRLLGRGLLAPPRRAAAQLARPRATRARGNFRQRVMHHEHTFERPRRSPGAGSRRAGRSRRPAQRRPVADAGSGRWPDGRRDRPPRRQRVPHRGSSSRRASRPARP